MERTMQRCLCLQMRVEIYWDLHDIAFDNTNKSKNKINLSTSNLYLKTSLPAFTGLHLHYLRDNAVLAWQKKQGKGHSTQTESVSVLETVARHQRDRLTQQPISYADTVSACISCIVLGKAISCHFPILWTAQKCPRKRGPTQPKNWPNIALSKPL